MECRPDCKPINAAFLSLSLCFCTLASAQDAANSKAKSGNSQVLLPDTVELNAFGGVSLFAQVDEGLGTRLHRGGTAGGRVTWNPTSIFGVEFSYNFMVNNVSTVAPIPRNFSLLPPFNFGNQIHYYAVNPVFNLLPRGHRVQPSITFGVGAAQFAPTGKAKTYATSVDAIYHSAGLGTSTDWALNYGGGLKFHISDHFGLRIDARGFFSPVPGFGLSRVPNGGVYIPDAGHLNGFQGTLGIVAFLGHKYVPPAPQPPPPPPAPLSAGTITGAEGNLCEGRAITLHSTASDPAGHTLTYAWKLNGAESGTNSPDFSFTPNNAGDFSVQVIISDVSNPSRTVTAGPLTLTVKEYVLPQIASVDVTPPSLTCSNDTSGTHTANLSGTATASACGGNLSYKWTVTEGSVSNDTSLNSTFDSSTLSFTGPQAQSKTVTATLTVTDETGKSASKSTQITVSCPAQFVRLPDVVFSKNNARVNNCGKRILIDEAASRIESGDYDIVLVAHRDTDERAETRVAGRRGRASTVPLDEQRALNSAAVLTAGTGTCGKIDLSRVRIDWVGTDQTSDPQPGLCGTSNRPAARERKGAAVTEADRNRRVEVYLVPHGGQVMPPSVKNSRPLPEGAIKALGCPR